MTLWRSVLRSVGRSPGFALTVTLFLGVSVAALLALATAVWALLAKPLPYPQGERLVSVAGHSEKMGFDLGFAAPLAERLGEFEQVEAVGFQRPGAALEDAQGVRLRTARVSASLLRLLGARPLLGRLPAEGEADDAVLISEPVWESRFNRDPGVLERPLELPGHRLRVIGVLPRGFGFPHRETAIWQPLVFAPAERAPDQASNWGDLQVYARLKPGATAAVFDEALNARWGALPELAGMREYLGLQMRVRSLRELWAADRARVLQGLGLAGVLVLLALCANLANLWLGRTLGRRRELAVRYALGAAGWRAAAPVLGEIALLTVAGVALGVGLTPLGLETLLKLGLIDPESPLPLRADLATALSALLATGLLYGLLALGPLWLVRRGGGVDDLGGGPRALSPAPAGARLRRTLVAFQIAAAATLLAGGGLLLRSQVALLESDTGFAGRGFVVAAVEPADAEDDDSEGSAQQRVAAWFDAVASLPGVRAASFAASPPFSRSEIVSTFEMVGEGRSESARQRLVGPGYFDLIRQPVLAGRGFEPDDGRAGAVIVDELFVKRHFPGRDPLGASLGVPSGTDPSDPERTVFQPARIVGVVATVKHQSLDEDATLGSVYQYVGSPVQEGILASYALLETDGAIAAMTPRLRELAQAHGLRLAKAATIEEWMRSTVEDRMPLLWLLGGFALACLLLCCTGLFALVQFAVASRRGEWGLRLALGASAGVLTRQLLGGAVRTAVPGLVLGLGGALALGQGMASRLYGVSPYDPLTLAVVMSGLILAALLAVWWPVRRVAAVAPAEVLRQE